MNFMVAPIFGVRLWIHRPYFQQQVKIVDMVNPNAVLVERAEYVLQVGMFQALRNGLNFWKMMTFHVSKLSEL